VAQSFTPSSRKDPDRPTRLAGALLVVGLLIAASALAGALSVGAVSAALPSPVPSMAPPAPYLVLTPNPGSVAVDVPQTYAAVSFSALNVNQGDVTPATTFSISPDGSCILNACSASVAGYHTVTGTDGVVTGSASLEVGISPSPLPVVPPSAPTNVVAAAGDTTASVSWLAPASDGGSPITGYSVSWSGGPGVACGGGTMTALICGLTNSTSTNSTPYTFTVAASNAAGTGPGTTSASVNAVSGATPPQTTTAVIPPGTSGTSTAGPAGGPTPSDPLTTSITVPPTSGGGTVAIVQTAPTTSPPSGGYAFLGQEVDITSTAQTTPANPLTIVFTIDASTIRKAFNLVAPALLPDPSSVTISRTEVVPPSTTSTTTDIVACTSTGAGGTAIAPDPCILSSSYVDTTYGPLVVTVLTSSASQWDTLIKPVPVTVLDGGYSPLLATVNQGGVVEWTFAGTRAHTVTDLLALGPAGTPWFTSGVILPGGRFGQVFDAAGIYAYHSTASKDNLFFVGVVTVPLRVTPSSGTAATPFTITWSSSSISGYMFDVRYRFLKTGSTKWTAWMPWLTGTPSAGGTFHPTLGAGTYSFISRVRNASTGNVSGWSLEIAISAR
jgi:plastocyanin